MTSAFRHVAGRQVKKIVVVVVARHNDTARMRRPYKRKRVKSEIADPVNVSLPGCRSTSNEFHIFRV